VAEWDKPGGKLNQDDPFFGLIEEAYTAFATHKPADVDVCVGHCMPEEIAQNFFVPDIRNLPLRWLNQWYSAAKPVGGVNKHIWTYLLPRIFEVLAVDDYLDACGIETTLQCYPLCDQSEWSAQQCASDESVSEEILRARNTAQSQ
jgi:hypothetical protein